MQNQFDRNRFAAALRTHRGTDDLRQAARQSGVSASTLSRLERGEMPDLEMFFKLLNWMNAPVSDFIEEIGQRPNTSPIKQVELVLRSDPFLKPEEAEALVVVYRSLRRRDTSDH